nr:hypothetical protein [Tanacetum cinerariifolium]
MDESREEGTQEEGSTTTKGAGVEFIDIFLTRSELAYHKYLMCGPIPSMFLRNPSSRRDSHRTSRYHATLGIDFFSFDLEKITCRKFLIENGEKNFTDAGDSVRIYPDGVFGTWMAFGENTRDLGSFIEETDEITDLPQTLEEVLLTECRDVVASIKRRHHDLFSNGVWNLEMASGHGRLKEDLESSTIKDRNVMKYQRHSYGNRLCKPLIRLGGDGCLGVYVRVVAGTGDEEHVCEEEMPLDNIGKQSGDLVEMPSEAVKQGMDDHVSNEIDGAKGEQVLNHVGKKGNLEFLVCKQVPNHGGNELVDKGRTIKRKRIKKESSTVKAGIENEVRSQEELAVFQVEYADMKGQMQQLMEELKKSQKNAFFKSNVIVFGVVGVQTLSGPPQGVHIVPGPSHPPVQFTTGVQQQQGGSFPGLVHLG